MLLSLMKIRAYVQKRVLGFRGKLTINVLVSSNSHFHPSVSYDKKNLKWQPCSFLLGFVFWVRGVYELEVLEVLVSFDLHVVTKLSVFLSLFVWCNCWFACYKWWNAQRVLCWKVKVDFICKKLYFIHDLCLVYVMETTITFNSTT